MSGRGLLRIALGLGGAGALVLGGFATGWVAQEQRVFPYHQVNKLLWAARALRGETARPLFQDYQGWWEPARHGPAANLSPAEAARLEALGYASGYEAPAPEAGILAWDREASAGGTNLYIAGHESSAVLMAMDGTALHRWAFDFERQWPDVRVFDRMGRVDHFRRVRLLEDGHLLAIFEGWALVELDRDSNLVWGHLGGEHHDLDLAPDGTIWVLTRSAETRPEIRPEGAVIEDAVAVLDRQGELLREFSLIDAFERSEYSSVLDGLAELDMADVFHTNTLQILDGRHADRLPAFARGNLLISLRTLSLLAVVDPRAEEVVWVATGMWRNQHEPVLLPSGNILVFDNEGHHGHSRVLEFDPVTQAVVWQYAGDEANGFHSSVVGSNQRLPGGNTLIVESTAGRAFEVTPEGEIVWDFVNPHRGGDEGELVAVLMDLVRLPPDADLSWLPTRAAAALP